MPQVLRFLVDVKWTVVITFPNGQSQIIEILKECHCSTKSLNDLLYKHTRQSFRQKHKLARNHLTWRVDVFNTTHLPFLCESRSIFAPSSSASSSGFISKIWKLQKFRIRAYFHWMPSSKRKKLPQSTESVNCFENKGRTLIANTCSK